MIKEYFDRVLLLIGNLDFIQVNKVSFDLFVKSFWICVFYFLFIFQRIVQFLDGKEFNFGDKIVYVVGVFDFFYVGLLDFFEIVKNEGDYFIVGFYIDQVVNCYKGSNYFIMSLY